MSARAQNALLNEFQSKMQHEPKERSFKWNY